MGLIELLAEIRTFTAIDPPMNKANTCDRVIRPILLELGYLPREIDRESKDNGEKFPDYTILPRDQEHRFYIEVKSWNVTLEDKHANQAVGYTNQNGARWAILTNGRKWKLYDDKIPGYAYKRLAVEADLSNVLESEMFFHAMSRKSILSGNVDQGIQALRDAQLTRQSTESAASDVLIEPSPQHSAEPDCIRRRGDIISVQDLRKKFWEDLIQYLAANGHPGERGNRVVEDRYIRMDSYPFEKSRVLIMVSMASKSRMRVAVKCVNNPTKSMFEKLLNNRREIEARFTGEEVSWERLEKNREDSRIAVHRSYDMDEFFNDTTQLQDLYGWICRNLITCKEVARRWLPETRASK